jgi:cytochrome c-type biogenesis protein CcmH/NrfF
VWVLPVVVGAGAVAGLVLVFRRWRTDAPREASDEDRELVDEALHELETRTPS